MTAGNYSLNMVKNMLPVKSKLLIYHSNVNSHLNYALSVWGPMLKERDVKKLQVQQNNSLKLTEPSEKGLCNNSIGISQA